MIVTISHCHSFYFPNFPQLYVNRLGDWTVINAVLGHGTEIAGDMMLNETYL